MFVAKRFEILIEDEAAEKALTEFFKPIIQLPYKINIRSSGGKLLTEYVPTAEIALRRDPDLVFFCLVDMYRIALKIPKHIDQASNPLEARFWYIKNELERRVDSVVRDRFRAFPVVMELETWVLADIQGLNAYLQTNLPPYTSPETIEQAADELKVFYKQHRHEDYRKHKRQMEQLFQHISAQRVYDDHCPHFKLLIDELKKLQQPSDQSTVPTKPPSPQDEIEQEWQRLEDKSDYWNQLVELYYDNIDFAAADELLKAIEAEQRKLYP